MPFLPNDEIKVAFRYTYLGQKCENVQTYLVGGVSSVLFTMDQVLEGLWNDYKARFRALGSTSTAVNTFDSLLGQQVGGSLQFAEFAIPSGERAGTRAAGDDGEWLTSFAAVGIRQTVGTRLTRPGQKRFPFLREGDVVGNAIAPTPLIPFNALGGAFSQVSVLGAPALGMALQPQVVHEPGARDPVRHVQPVIGWVTNSNVTSQVSRKLGRGT
jgi:hypothetical protein